MVPGPLAGPLPRAHLAVRRRHAPRSLSDAGRAAGATWVRRNRPGVAPRTARPERKRRVAALQVACGGSMALAAALAAAVPAALAALVVLQLDKTVITDRLVRDVSPTPICEELDPPEYTRTTMHIPSVGLSARTRRHT